MVTGVFCTIFIFQLFINLKLFPNKVLKKHRVQTGVCQGLGVGEGEGGYIV